MSATTLGSRNPSRSGCAKKEVLRRLHVVDHSSWRKDLFDGVAFLACCAAAVLVWQAGWWYLVPLFWVAGGYFGYTKPLYLHDAAHGTLNTRPWLNELLGVILGTFLFVPLTVYRHAHARHHAALSSERDPELWPFVLPHFPRGLRVLAAVLELVFGIVYTPLLFLRSVFACGPIPRRTKVRIAGEYVLMLGFWSAAVLLVQVYGWWEPLLIGFVVPAWLLGLLQTLNKYTEHLGLTGDSILTNTRTVVDERTLGRMLSYSMLHIDHHGTHHRYARIPFYNLPQATPYVYDGGERALPVYRSYVEAMIDMLRTLPDPRAGGQWNRARDAA